MSGKAKNTENSAAKKRPKIYKYTVEQILDACKKSYGNVDSAARHLGCDWHSMDRYKKLFPEVAQALKDAKARQNNGVEISLYNASREVERGLVIGPNGKPQEAWLPTEKAIRAQMFIAKTQMGWSEKAQHQVDINAPVAVEITRI